MPQRTERVADAMSPSCLQAAEAMKKLLLGLGHFHLQLDGLRLSVPSPVVKKLGYLRHEPFIFTPWPHQRLRIVPQSFWNSYQTLIREQSGNQLATEDLLGRLQQLSEPRLLDSRNRWDIPTIHAKYAGFYQQREVVLLPSRFWLEALSAANWEMFFVEAMKMAQEATKVSDTSHKVDSSQAVPTIPQHARCRTNVT